jgi:hypothetical protein
MTIILNLERGKHSEAIFFPALLMLIEIKLIGYVD